MLIFSPLVCLIGYQCSKEQIYVNFAHPFSMTTPAPPSLTKPSKPTGFSFSSSLFYLIFKVLNFLVQQLRELWSMSLAGGVQKKCNAQRYQQKKRRFHCFSLSWHTWKCMNVCYCYTAKMKAIYNNLTNCSGTFISW